MRHPWPALIILALATAGWPALAQPQDTDKDGLPDAVEEQLATDPTVAEHLQTIGTFKHAEGPKANMQVAKVEFGNVGQHRWLWAIHFEKPYSFTNAQIIIYLDADNDPKTGRTGMGCEYMLSHNEGAGGVQAFAPDGGPATANNPRVALYNGVLYMCSDHPLKQENGKSVFRYTILSEYREPHTSADSTAWVSAVAAPDSAKKVVLTIDEITLDEHVMTTEGLDLIWKLQADPANICFRSPQAELKNMHYYDTEYRWWAVTGSNGSITVTVPQAGTFYPAVVTYDYYGAETYQMLIDGKAVGSFLDNEGRRRQQIHFLDKPIAFKGGEKFTIKTGSAGPHVTEDLMLLAKRPPVRPRDDKLEHIEIGPARVEGQDVMRLTFITTWPATCYIEYWPSSDKGTERLKKVSDPEAIANHRLYLDGLERGVKYTVRITTRTLDNSFYRVTPDPSFVFQPRAVQVGTAKRERTPLTVRNPHDFPVSNACLSTGVPFAQGELGDPAHVRLLGADGAEEPVQVKSTAYWLDGSIKWLLVTFMDGVGAKETVTHQLEFGSQVTRQQFGSGMELKRDGQQVTVNTGRLRASFDVSKSALPTMVTFDTDSGWETATQLPVAAMKDATGKAFNTLHAPERIEIEEEGPIRTIIKVVGHHQDAAGKPFMAYIIRYVFCNEQTAFKVYYTFGNDEASDMTGFKGLALSLPVGPGGKWTTAVDGNVQTGVGELSLRQMEDNVCTAAGGRPRSQ